MAPHSPAVKFPSRATAPAMGAHRWSHAITKAAAPPPRKIRIVHVLAPEVIKTDVRHFRELVQRLTGKPNGVGGRGTPSSSSSESAAESSQPAWSSDAASAAVPAEGGSTAAANTTIKAEVKEEADASPEEGCLPTTPENVDIMNDMFFQGLEDLLFSSGHMDGLL